MLSPVRKISVGALKMRGHEWDFVPPKEAIFHVRANEDLRIGLEYDYEEGNAMKEEFEVVFTVGIEGQGDATMRAKVVDLPAVKDHAAGSLTRHARFTKPGDVWGNYKIDVTYSRANWATPDDRAVFRIQRTGRFIVKVS